MFQPVKAALGTYLIDFFKELQPTTKALVAFKKRAPKTAVLFAPSRMIDAANEMFVKYLRADVKEGLTCDVKKPATTPHLLPVMLVALSQDVTPTSREYTHQITERVPFIFPDDTKERVFHVRAVSNDIRAQVVFFAQDEPTARSMGAQFLLYLDQWKNRTFYADFGFAGFKGKWPCQIDNPEVFTPAMASEAQNLVTLASDVTLHCTVPIFYAPQKGEPNDGKGTPGSLTDPAGYPLVEEVVTTANGKQIADDRYDDTESAED